jgi:hypothetical protein
MPGMSQEMPESLQDPWVRVIVRELLRVDAKRAGQLISGIQDAGVRDIALSETVGWLVERSSFEEARLLAGKIQETALRRKAEAGVAESEDE